jgi:hypothetical protein
MVRCLVQNLELVLQSFQIKEESDQDMEIVKGEEILFEETLPTTLASASASIARTAEVSPSASDNAA